MSEKIWVTREQQDAIEEYKDIKKELDYLISLKKYFNSNALRPWARPVLNMTSDQIAAAWLGVAEVEPEPVEPWEALKALYENKRIRAVDSDGEEVELNKIRDLHLHFDWFVPEDVKNENTKFYIMEDE